MTFFLRELKYYSIDMFHSLDGMFWTVLYPLILGLLYFVIFASSTTVTNKPIDIGITEQNPIKAPLVFIEFFNTHIIEEQEADTLLQSKKIQAFIQNDLSIRVRENGIVPSIIKSVVEQIQQTMVLGIPITYFNYDINYIESKNEKQNAIMVMFYSLLAMVSIYGMFGGITITEKLQANLSKLAVRLAASPMNRFLSYISGMLFYVVFNTLANVLYIGFIQFVLQIPFITDFSTTFLLILYANIFGTSLGLCIGSVPAGDEQTKMFLCVFASLFLSFLSGMMSPSVKIAIEHAVPLLALINPIALLTSNIYNINILQEYSLLASFLAVYTGFIGISLFITFLNSRKVCYDSL